MLTLQRAQFYKVKQGQTLQQIAQAFGLPITLIIQANALTAPVYGGQILFLPNVTGNLYTVQAGDYKDLLSGNAEHYCRRNGTDILYPTLRIFL